MIMQPSFTNVLSDHFSLYPLLISPFYWILGTWTMLIFQISAVLFGGLGVYRYVLHLTKSESLSRVSLVHFFSIWGIYSALSFDYHDNVVAAMFVPWFLYYVELEKWKNSVFFFALILIAKENMALWAVFIGFGLTWKAAVDKSRKKIIVGSIFSLVALTYFICVIKFIIPSLATPGRTYLHNSFNALGSNFGEVIVNIFKHPIDTFKLLFVNHSGDSMYDGVKAETYLAIVASGGLAFILAPQYFIMIIPILAQKVLNDLPIRWGISAHYSIEFAPILVIALYTVIAKVKKWQMKLALLSLAVTMIANISFLDHRTSEYYNQENSRFYQKKHWERDFDVSKAHQMLALIPKNARVSAQSSLCPHLAFRDYIYHYPFIGDANFIALIPAEVNKYPLNDETYQQAIDDFISSGEWEIFDKSEAILILKKKKLSIVIPRKR